MRVRVQLAVGRPDIYPEMPVTVQGWDAVIDATDWIVAKTTHSLDGNSGYTTAIELENRATACDSPALPEDDGEYEGESA
jgi:phage protein D